MERTHLKKTLWSCLVLLAAILTSTAASAEAIKLTLATTLAPNSTIELAARQYADILGEKSNNRINVVHYGAGSLYNAKDLIPALAKNQVNMAVHHVAMVGRRSGILEFISSFGALGCWASYDHYYRFIDQPEVRSIADAEFEKYFNAKLLGMLAYGTSLYASTDNPIANVADFDGLKIRSSGSAMASLYKALGAAGVEMSSSELYTALQRGTIQACSTGSSRVRRARLYEVAPYITVDPTIPFMTFWLVINKDVWNKLSPEDQDLLTREAAKMETWTRNFAADERDTDLDFIASKAKEFHDMSQEEKEKLVTVARPAMMAFSKEQLGDSYQKLWDLLDQAR